MAHKWAHNYFRSEMASRQTLPKLGESPAPVMTPIIGHPLAIRVAISHHALMPNRSPPEAITLAIALCTDPPLVAARGNNGIRWQ